MQSERDERFSERLVSREVVHQGNFLTLHVDEVADKDGDRHSREVVIHPGGVAIVPLHADGRLVLVRQYRHAVGETLLEIPAGTLDRAGDGSLEDPLAAARRELVEETGQRAARWRPLVDFYTAPGFASERLYVYLATGLEDEPGYDGPAADERLEVVTLPFGEVLSRAARGEIHDAKTLVGALLTDALARAGEVAELRAS